MFRRYNVYVLARIRDSDPKPKDLGSVSKEQGEVEAVYSSGVFSFSVASPLIEQGRSKEVIIVYRVSNTPLNVWDCLSLLPSPSSHPHPLSPLVVPSFIERLMARYGRCILREKGVCV